MHRAYQQGMALRKCSKSQPVSLDADVGMITGKNPDKPALFKAYDDTLVE